MRPQQESLIKDEFDTTARIATVEGTIEREETVLRKSKNAAKTLFRVFLPSIEWLEANLRRYIDDRYL